MKEVSLSFVSLSSYFYSSKSTNYPNTAQNFFKNTITEVDEPESNFPADKQNANNDNDGEANDNEDDSEVEIGCKE